MIITVHLLPRESQSMTGSTAMAQSAATPAIIIATLAVTSEVALATTDVVAVGAAGGAAANTGTEVETSLATREGDEAAHAVRPAGMAVLGRGILGRTAPHGAAGTDNMGRDSRRTMALAPTGKRSRVLRQRQAKTSSGATSGRTLLATRARRLCRPTSLVTHRHHRLGLAQ